MSPWSPLIAHGMWSSAPGMAFLFLVSQPNGYGLGRIKPSSPAQALLAKVQVVAWALGERWDVTGLPQFHNILACWAHVPLVFSPIATGTRGPFLHKVRQQEDSSAASPGHLGRLCGHCQ